MNFQEFLGQLTHQLYVYRMASGQIGRDTETTRSRAAQARMKHSQQNIDDLVLSRAKAIKKERGMVQ